MVRVPRIGRLRISPRLTQRWRARLRAQRRWWRAQWRAEAAGEVLFPPAGRGMVAVETLAGAEAGGGPRIAILHATAGSGHKRAAQALAVAIESLRPGAVVREVDTLVFASRLYRDTYAASYNAMAARAPALWGALYRSWAVAPVNRSTAPVRLAMDRLNLRRLVRVVERENPDAVVCTHFLPVEALSPRRGRGRLRVPLYCVITDFTAHPFWVFPHVDRYFVASERVAAELAGHGVPRERIEVTGIPIDPRFAHPLGRDAARERFGLDPRRPMVLVMGGGGGVGPLAGLAERIASLALEPQVLVVCGTNRRLRDEIDRLPLGRIGRIRTLGFTHEVDVLLEACDAVVSKAGGLTCSEALVKHVPLVIFRPTPGQEERNAEFLESGGAAIHADSVEAVESTLGRWLADPAARERVREAAARLAAPRAAEAIARRVLSEMPQVVARSA
jgi:processive 1,2-diacylglycerol beta-glucosyltransferase